MLRKYLVLIAILFVACAPAQLPEKDSVSLATDTDLLKFDAVGGEQSFTVSSSEPIYLVRGDSWISCRKGEKSSDHMTLVTVTVTQNTYAASRQSKVSVVAGNETINVEIKQAGQSGNMDSDDDADTDDPSAMYVALSFDDGPNNHTTAQMLDILEEYNVVASFFVIGQYINDSTAGQMKRAVSLGCEIQNHSFTHSHMTQMSVEKVIDELNRTDDLVEKYTSTRPTLFRPPYIDHNTAMHNAIDHTFISGIGCQDWDAGQSATARYNEVMNKVQDGDIILLHDFYGNDNTVEALPMIITELKKRGYNLVTVSELFEKKGISPSAHSGYLYTNVMQKEFIQYR